MKINLDSIEDIQKRRALSDLLNVYKMDTFMSVKGYLQKLIDLCLKLGYYEFNESIFEKSNLNKF